jgi:hypothetical protein
MFCTKNRLNILLLETYGGALEIILDIIAKQITSSSILSSLHFKLSKIFVRSKIGLKLSGKTSKKFPLGYCLVAEKADLQ